MYRTFRFWFSCEEDFRAFKLSSKGRTFFWDYLLSGGLRLFEGGILGKGLCRSFDFFFSVRRIFDCLVGGFLALFFEGNDSPRHEILIKRSALEFRYHCLPLLTRPHSAISEYIFRPPELTGADRTSLPRSLPGPDKGTHATASESIKCSIQVDRASRE